MLNKIFQPQEDLKQSTNIWNKETRDLIAHLSVVGFGVVGLAGSVFKLSDLDSTTLRYACSVIITAVAAGFVYLALDSELRFKYATRSHLAALDEDESQGLPEQERKERVLAVLYIQNYKAKFWKPWAVNCFNKYRGSLHSWNMLNNPERFHEFIRKVSGILSWLRLAVLFLFVVGIIVFAIGVASFQSEQVPQSSVQCLRSPCSASLK